MVFVFQDFNLLETRKDTIVCRLVLECDELELNITTERDKKNSLTRFIERVALFWSSAL